MAIVLTPVVPTSTPMNAVALFAAESLVDDLVCADGVLARLRLAQRCVIDPGGDRVDEPPLQHAAAYGADRIFRVRVKVEAEPLALVAVAGATQLHCQL